MKVCAGRRSSSDPRDPYFVAASCGKFEFIEDPYSGLWRKMIRIMFTNPDSADANYHPLGAPPHSPVNSNGYHQYHHHQNNNTSKNSVVIVDDERGNEMVMRIEAENASPRGTGTGTGTGPHSPQNGGGLSLPGPYNNDNNNNNNTNSNGKNNNNNHPFRGRSSSPAVRGYTSEASLSPRHYGGHFVQANVKTLYRQNSNGDLEVSGREKARLRKASWYFLYQNQNEATERPAEGTKRARHLSSVESRRDQTFGTKYSGKDSPDGDLRSPIRSGQNSPQQGGSPRIPNILPLGS